MLVPPTIHQAQKYLVNAPLNALGVPGDPADANDTAAIVTWTQPCGDKDVVEIDVLSKPDPHSGNAHVIPGGNVIMEVSTHYAIIHTGSEAMYATTAKFKCCKFPITW
jgi:hypothetical protein